MTSVTWDRHRGHAETYDVVDLGFNYRLDEPRAAMALAQIPMLDDRTARLREVVGRYRELLGGIDGLTIPFNEDQIAVSGLFAMPVLVEDAAKRDLVRARLAERRIQTTFYPSLTSLDLYRNRPGANPAPIAEGFAERHLALPLWRGMSGDQVELACTELEAALDG
jgi:dTDP-4-amino-4,6-dideoxygalactose transaminase